MLNKLKFTPYSEVRKIVDTKAGRVPPKPDHLPTGKWTDQAIKVLSERYLQKDSEGNVVETPDELCWRVAWEVASADTLWSGTKKDVEALATDFNELLISHEF